MENKPIIKKLRHEIRRKGYASKTEKAYVNWVIGLIRYHNHQPVSEMDRQEIVEYLNYLVNERNVANSTHNQALCAISFLFNKVLGKDIKEMKNLTYSKKPKRLPSVMSAKEAKSVIQQLTGMPKLVAFLMYGTGLRISEVMRLRIQDIDFANSQIYVRNAKGLKDRTTLLPKVLKKALIKQMARVKTIHRSDKTKGYGTVPVPKAIGKKYPNAATSTGWQYLFPSAKISRNRRSGKICRHNASPSTVQKAIKKAVEKAGITKQVTAHTFRHSFATQMLQSKYDIRLIQELLGHKNLKTTMKYTHVTAKPETIKSPIETL